MVGPAGERLVDDATQPGRPSRADRGLAYDDRVTSVPISNGARARRDPRRRRALLEAADRVIQRDGPEASMATIAAEAGISKPILYRHFGDKSGLYQALAERHIRRLIEDVRAEFLHPGDMRERTRASIDTYLSSISANLGLYRFLMHRASAEDQATHSSVSTVIREVGREIADVMSAEMRFADQARAHIWGHAVVGMVHTAGDWWLDHPEMSRETVVTALVDLILDGLPAAAESGTGPPATDQDAAE